MIPLKWIDEHFLSFERTTHHFVRICRSSLPRSIGWGVSVNRARPATCPSAAGVPPRCAPRRRPWDLLGWCVGARVCAYVIAFVSTSLYSVFRPGQAQRFRV